MRKQRDLFLLHPRVLFRINRMRGESLFTENKHMLSPLTEQYDNMENNKVIKDYSVYSDISEITDRLCDSLCFTYDKYQNPIFRVRQFYDLSQTILCFSP